MQRTKNDAIGFREAAALRAQAEARSPRGPARPPAAAAEPATRRCDAQEFARLAPRHAAETIELARPLPAATPRGSAERIRPPLTELADVLEPEFEVTWGLQASVRRLARRAPAAAIAFLIALLAAIALALGVRKQAVAPRPASADAARSTARAQREMQSSANPAEAVDLLASGRYAEALARYEQLARAHPAEPAYAAVCVILRHNLAADCAQRRKTGDTACRAGP